MNIKKIMLFMFSLPLFLFGIANAEGLKPSFVWDANSETNLAGYKIYVGETTNTYTSCVIDVNNVTTYTFTDQDITDCNMIENKTYYFTATAYDTDGFESDYADEVPWTTPNLPPGVVQHFQVAVIVNNPDGSVDVFDTDGNLLFHYNN